MIAVACHWCSTPPICFRTNLYFFIVSIFYSYRHDATDNHIIQRTCGNASTSQMLDIREDGKSRTCRDKERVACATQSSPLYASRYPRNVSTGTVGVLCFDILPGLVGRKGNLSLEPRRVGMNQCGGATQPFISERLGRPPSTVAVSASEYSMTRRKSSRGKRQSRSRVLLQPPEEK